MKTNSSPVNKVKTKRSFAGIVYCVCCKGTLQVDGKRWGYRQGAVSSQVYWRCDNPDCSAPVRCSEGEIVKALRVAVQYLEDESELVRKLFDGKMAAIERLESIRSCGLEVLDHYLDQPAMVNGWVSEHFRVWVSTEERALLGTISKVEYL